jgi:O-antigen biosynthesis protein
MMVRRDALLWRREAARATGGDGAPAAEPPPEPSFDAAEGGGLLDEDFFMYGEDLDWCFRIQQAGWKIYYTPSTQIIHYKGESTRKGELRYVRLFYGAMLQFAEKHFAGEHSRIVAGMIRAGILARALLSVGNKALHALAAPLLDFILALAAGLAAGALWSLRTDVAFPILYYGGVAPTAALGAVGAIALAGGYRRRSQRSGFPLRPVLSGLFAAFLAMTSALFFLPDLAFSRATLILSFVGTAVAAVGWRLAANRQLRGPRRALLVGSSAEAERLRALLARRLDPPLRLEGFVGNGAEGSAGVPLLGGLRHLRDLVRLRQIDDVVFASDSLTNTAILEMMRELRDLPVQFRILTEGQDRIIGKASVDDLSTPLREAEAFVAPVRSALARRAFEGAVALLGLVLLPALRVALALRPRSERLRRLAAASRQLPAVLAGRWALVGFDPSGPHPPSAWGLRPGLVSILDTLPEPPTDIVGAHRAYWFYARNQSAALDLEILLRVLSRPS